MVKEHSNIKSFDRLYGMNLLFLGEAKFSVFSSFQRATRGNMYFALNADFYLPFQNLKIRATV
jgi:hypothetical protein